jgi:hypothetical protein
MLNHLDRFVSRGQKLVPRAGPPGWDELQRVPRKLLEYMHDRDSAVIDDELCLAVWGERRENVTKGSVDTDLRRANKYLASLKWAQNLHHDSGAEKLYWR